MILDSDIEILRRAGLWGEVQSLVDDHRLFIDLYDLQKIDELKSAIKNERVKEVFERELIAILADYPDDIKGEEKRIKSILCRLARLFDVESPMQTGWYTHINGDIDELHMLTLHAGDDKWYNFMACKDYLMIEKTKPSTKHILGLWGSQETGKTPTAKMVFQILKCRYPRHAVIFYDDPKNYDVRGFCFIGNAKVSVDTQGDPTGMQMENLDNFVSIGCDVDFLCSRNFGRTVCAIEKYANTHIIEWEGRDVRNIEEEKEAANRAQAYKIVELIEQYASIV